MIDLEQQLADHLQRKAAAVTPRYDLDAIEHGTGSLVVSDSSRVGRRIWMAAAALVVVVIGAVVVIVYRAGDGDSISTTETDVTVSPSVTPSPTVLEVVPTIPPTTSPLVGNWVSLDPNGLIRRLEIVDSGEDVYGIVIDDTGGLTACAGSSATISGTGRLESAVRLVIAQPELTCDDGSAPSIGPPPQERLANLTFELDPASDELVDSGGVVWHRPGTLGSPAPSSDPSPLASGGMWPQTTLDEVRAAQASADAGDPDYTWQIGTQLTTADVWANSGDLEVSARFLREVLGWESFIFNSYSSGDETGDGSTNGWTDGVLGDLEFLRCEPGRTNPIYPPGPEGRPGTLCAPTIDDLHYEAVRLDLAQLDRQGLEGIWVVEQWTMIPFAQSDPAPVIARARAHLEQQMAARVAGRGAEEQGWSGDIQLVYATSAGSAYERYDIELSSVGEWPDGDWPIFTVRLFADGGATVVEQEAEWKGLWAPMDVGMTTENGVPVPTLRSSVDGELTLSAPDPWGDGPVWGTGGWGLTVGRSLDDDTIHVDFTDPVGYDAWCESIGGDPLLSAPADAATIAERVIADPNLDTTAPVTVRVGGVEAISIDVELASGGSVPCGRGSFDSRELFEVTGRWIHELAEPRTRLRLYLVDMPQGMTVPTMAITIVAPQDRFDEVVEMTKPIIDSIEFHPN